MDLREEFVSELRGRTITVVSDGKPRKLGKLEDLSISGSDDAFPPVTRVYVRGTDGVLRYAPFSAITAISRHEVSLRSEPIDFAAADRPAGELLLGKDLLDKQILDVDGRKVVRINDLKLAPAGETLRVIAADIGLSGLLRRMGLRGLGQRWLERASRPGIRQALISWDTVQPLHRDAEGDAIRLRVPQDKMQRIHPADLAAIIEDLNAADQASLMGSLDEETAAEAFEQLDVDTQLSILEDIQPDRAADIIENMEPDDAADLLGEVEPERQQEILSLMEPDEAKDVRELLTHDEETAGGLMTTEYLWLPPGLTVADAFAHIRKAAEDAELVYYLYVLDTQEHILGVVTLRNLVTAELESPVANIMTDDVVTVHTGATREEVASTIARYDFLAVPVVDDDGRMQGIVTVDDAMDVVLPEKLRKMLPRVGRSRSKGRVGT
ncbi:MAG TPA: CBS domain-containing protein [Candidatus Eremiobacteraceae bacterium]|nr:CBS domain-containing protein [Candidatus Eremiobacteraceae bacterium]